MLQAEADCNGQLLNPYHRDKGDFAHTALWEVNDNTARKYMSDEMAHVTAFVAAGGLLIYDKVRPEVQASWMD